MMRFAAAALTVFGGILIITLFSILAESMLGSQAVRTLSGAVYFISGSLLLCALGALIAIFLVPEGDNWRQVGSMGLISLGLFVSGMLPGFFPIQTFSASVLWLLATLLLVAGGWWLFYESTGVH